MYTARFIPQTYQSAPRTLFHQ